MLPTPGPGGQDVLLHDVSACDDIAMLALVMIPVIAARVRETMSHVSRDSILCVHLENCNQSGTDMRHGFP